MESTIHDYMERSVFTWQQQFHSYTSSPTIVIVTVPQWGDLQIRLVIRCARDVDDLVTFQRQDHTNALKYVVLTSGRILADHTYALWCQRTNNGIQFYRDVKLLHPDTLPSHIPSIHHANKRSIRRGQLEAIVKYAADSRIGEYLSAKNQQMPSIV